ncbi:MAG: nitroreductase family protein [Desulfofustis sp.]
MDVYEAIQTRRSVRSYQSGDVSDDVVERLLRAAMLAPSAGNQRPWRFLVVRDRDKLSRIPSFHPYCKMITQVPVAIVVCGDPSAKKWPDLWPQDCSAAVQNLLLAARAEGLGAVWTGVYPFEERMAGLRRLFAIPAQIYPFAVVPVGYPKDPGESFKAKDRYQPELVHWEYFA